MFNSIEVVKDGNAKQRAVYRAVKELRIMEDLRAYNPVLCGTIPLAIDVDDSDLDIIMEVYDYSKFNRVVEWLYSDTKGFRVKETEIRGERVLKVNFLYAGFEFELFGQAVPVEKQHAFVHMQIEYEILKQNPDIIENIIQLKQQGVKTEPAFCQVLGIEGKDPYEDLIRFGKKLVEI
ncbi:DUF4269 domain-containing protein [Paucisalibacillus globulus]|uniref:DUF4269 domain-containing protein n=1 Tax=Paucisalibacillus globulus TaxID=351095 RepID=UPI0003FBDECF|nr:DUF4269 domain-containing protein [Paucisalibacillus globulus]